MNIKPIIRYKGPDNTKQKRDCQTRIGHIKKGGSPDLTKIQIYQRLKKPGCIERMIDFFFTKFTNVRPDW